METKSLRKSLRMWLEGLTKAQTELESLNTKENQEIMLRYPIKEWDWRHPQSHILERTFYFLEQTRKCTQKMIEALPAERKTKVVKFIEPKPPKRTKKDGKASSKKVEPEEKLEKGRPSLSEPAASEINRKTRGQNRNKRDGDLGTKAGVDSTLRKVRKARSDKGSKRSRP